MLFAGSHSFRRKLNDLRGLAETALVADILRGTPQHVAGQRVYSSPAQVYGDAVQSLGQEGLPVTPAAVRRTAREQLSRVRSMIEEDIGILYDRNGQPLDDAGNMIPGGTSNMEWRRQQDAMAASARLAHDLEMQRPKAVVDHSKWRPEDGIDDPNSPF